MMMKFSILMLAGALYSGCVFGKNIQLDLSDHVGIQYENEVDINPG